MAQSALTVTNPNPTPPTNMSFSGATPPNPPNYTKNTYIDWLADTDSDTYPPPYLECDASTAGSLVLFAAATSALTSGSGATGGGTEGTYPGAASGTVPASTSTTPEGAGTEVSVLAAGNIVHTYPGAVTMNTSQTCSAGPTQTAATIAAGPNASHASTMNPGTNPALASISPTTAAAAASGTQAITCTGTNFTNQCRIWVDNMQRDTTFTSATTISCTVNKKPSAGTWLVDVKLGGVAVPSTRTFTWT